ncbi:transporter [Acinetobacter qingfengensis]|uniref:Uncharacterized protein n=1 Tax=Acinetobacter qingfengensis TaxID=1262585 RepID=A0A1E7QXE8_9GAMM|nr:transporter [Acinetobacter qingfengensis]KAA8731655.1 transporter [Acinetobacter qingfengensis]OEY91758.1 hypothetical protein BJI46_06340 [Acinetobacter qingfengensis]
MKKLMLMALACASTMTQISHALDVDAGDYDYVPNGVNLGLIYYQHAVRDTLYSGSQKMAGDAKLTSDIGIARYVHYMEVGGVQIAPQILIPFGHLDAEQDISALGSASGLGDIILANTFFVHHDTASKTMIGITPYLYLPTGNYDQNGALNIGENRYKLTVQGAVTISVAKNLLWDVLGDVTFYGKNDDYATGELKQNMGYQLQTNMRYQMNDRVDLRAGLSYADFGDTRVNGVTTDAMTQSKFWLGTAVKPTTTTQLIATYGQDIRVENGFKESHRMNLRFLKVF